MLPAHERLDPAKTAARDIDDWLEVEYELVLRDRATELEGWRARHDRGDSGTASGAPSPSQSVALFGAARPRWRYVRSVATRPRGVRFRKPSWRRYGS